MNREYRMMNPMEIQTEQKKLDSECYVEGYATTFGKYVLFDGEDGPIYEEFRKENFANTDMTDIIMQYDHTGNVMARQRNNTLIVEVDDNGIKIAADLSKSEPARTLYEEIKNGLVDRMSWAFTYDNMNYDKETRTISYDNIKKIYDVSAVSIPANEDTSIYARSKELVDGAIEKAQQELLKMERAKAALKLKLKLEEF